MIIGRWPLFPGPVFVWVLFLWAAGACKEAEPLSSNDGKSPVSPSSSVSPDDPPTATREDPCVAGCLDDCRLQCDDTGRIYAQEAERVKDAPFSVVVDRAYLAGACAKGPDPARRKNTVGLKAIIEGSIVWEGDDLLLSAELQGTVVLDLNGRRVAAIPSMPAGEKLSGSRLLDEVRGADPWVKGNLRKFRFESLPMSEGFCEVAPRSVQVHVALKTMGIRDGKKDWVAAVVPLAFEEVLGMPLKGQVKVVKGDVTEPADAHFAHFDQLLVTRLDGTTEWLRRTQIREDGPLARGEAASFPMKVSGEQWQVTLQGISSSRSHGTFSPPGEDEFLVLVRMEFMNISDAAAGVGAIRPALEVEPGQWVSPVPIELGAIGRGEELEPGASISGVLVFVRRRFERPFRLRLELPGGSAIHLKVFSDTIGPERSPL